jgi:hypothetical protein
MAGLSIVGTDRAFRERRPRRDAVQRVGMSRDAPKVITSCFLSREYTKDVLIYVFPFVLL